MVLLTPSDQMDSLNKLIYFEMILKNSLILI
jgi:hypothetical protein